MKLRVLCWNVLADCYSKKLPLGTSLGITAAIENYKRPFFLEWDYRSNLIRNTLVESKSDILCLQEVDHFEEFFAQTLADAGFKAVYSQRPRRNDGCAICFKSNSFELIYKEVVDLDQIAEKVILSSRSKYSKQNIALIVILKDRASQKEILVSTCHIHWNPNLPEVKSAQARFILDRIAAVLSKSADLQGSAYPIILCGDFNSIPTDDIYGLIISPNPGSVGFINHQYMYPSHGRVEGVGHRYLTGPGTKFLCDASLGKLCKWMRVLGINVALDSWEYNKKSCKINQFFERARKERRVILTTSKTLRERSACPQSHLVYSNDMELSLAEIFYEYNLTLSRDSFLTVCGKCGGAIEEANIFDHRIMGKIMPIDRPVFACVECAQVNAYLYKLFSTYRAYH